MAYVMAVDAGTTGVRSIAFDRSGLPVAEAYRELTQHFPQPGWVEHDAAEIATLVDEVVGEVHDAMGGPPVTIGITNQRETVVVWDRTSGEPLHRAIVWQDRRTAQRCRDLEEAGHLPMVRERTGLVLDPYFSGTKAAWIFTEGGVEPGPDVAFGTVDSWVLWHLTGGAVHATDVSNASRTMLYDITRTEWSDELCDLLGVPKHVLPEVKPSSGRFGTTAASSPLGAGVPVSGIAGDQQSALFGQACFEPGMTKNTYGTGSFVLMNVGGTCPPTVEGLLSTVAWSIGDEVTYAYEGAIFVTGAAVQWLRDGLGIIEQASEVGPLAESVPDSGGVVLVPAFTGLGSPWWDPEARGTMLGITRGTGRAHLARAVVDAMVLQTRDVVEAMCDAAGREVTALRADGGAAAMDVMLRRQADHLGVPVSRPAVLDTTALGAAYLAGLAEGYWESTDDVSANWAVDLEVAPSGDRDALDAEHRRWREAVTRSASLD